MEDNDLEQRIIRYWDNQPCNILHGTAKVGTLDFYQQVSERRYRVESHMREFAGFHLWQGKRVLEIGCGIGTDAAEFARYGADYTAIDISPKTVDLAQQRFKVEGLEGRFICGDASDPAVYQDIGKFDLVYSCGVMHHFPRIDHMIQNAYDVLVPHGEFRFLVYAKNSWKYSMIRKGLDQFEAQNGCPYAKAYTNDEVYALVGDRFHIERLRQAHCFMYDVSAYKQGRYELAPWFSAMPEDMREAIKEYLGWHLLVKARRT
jgi:SAM-dependent methyltransferase